MSPVYSYQCVYCGERAERLSRIADEPPFCKECGKPTVQIWSKPAPASWKCSKGSL